MTSQVVPLRGGLTGEKKVNPRAVEALEELLEMAWSGEIVGIAAAGMCHDGCGMYRVAGLVGGYSMLGAIDVVRSEVSDIVRAEP